jgi:transcriptional regulator with XRE-family HTH domain
VVLDAALRGANLSTVTIGERIRQVRETIGLSQEGLGARCKPPIDKAHITHYETGAQIPGLRVCARIATAVGVSVAELLRGVEIPAPEPAAAPRRRRRRSRRTVSG